MAKVNANATATPARKNKNEAAAEVKVKAKAKSKEKAPVDISKRLPKPEQRCLLEMLTNVFGKFSREESDEGDRHFIANKAYAEIMFTAEGEIMFLAEDDEWPEASWTVSDFGKAKTRIFKYMGKAMATMEKRIAEMDAHRAALKLAMKPHAKDPAAMPKVKSKKSDD